MDALAKTTEIVKRIEREACHCLATEKPVKEAFGCFKPSAKIVKEEKASASPYLRARVQKVLGKTVAAMVLITLVVSHADAACVAVSLLNRSFVSDALADAMVTPSSSNTLMVGRRKDERNVALVAPDLAYVQMGKKEIVAEEDVPQANKSNNSCKNEQIVEGLQRAAGEFAPTAATISVEAEESSTAAVATEVVEVAKRAIVQQEDGHPSVLIRNDMLMQDLSAQIKQDEADRDESAATKAKELQGVGDVEGGLKDTTPIMEEDKKYLADLTAACEQKASAFESRQQLRAEELEAVGRAIGVVSSGAVAGNAEKYLPSFVQGSPLAQLRTTAQSSSQARVAAFLQNKAAQAGSRVLNLSAERVEANEEAEHKGWCDTEVSANEQTRKEKTAAGETLQAEVDELEASIAKLTGDVTVLTKAVAELDVAVAKVTQLRQEEKAKNTETTSDAGEAQTAVAQALIVLKEFYAVAAEATAFARELDNEEMNAQLAHEQIMQTVADNVENAKREISKKIIDMEETAQAEEEAWGIIKGEGVAGSAEEHLPTMFKVRRRALGQRRSRSGSPIQDRIAMPVRERVGSCVEHGKEEASMPGNNVGPGALAGVKGLLSAKAAAIKNSETGISSLSIKNPECASNTEAAIALIREMQGHGVVFAIDGVTQIWENTGETLAKSGTPACAIEVAEKHADLFQIQKLAVMFDAQS